MRLPNGGRAIVDLRKLTDYCLNPGHLRGRHKARVFAAALGLSAVDAEGLRQVLLASAAAVDAELASSDEWGDRYVLDFHIARGGWDARVRSSWIVRRGEKIPRLTTCFVLVSGSEIEVARDIKLLDTVALLQDPPEARLQRGQVGTVVEELAPGVFEVEFSDDRGQTYASLGVESSRLLGLLYEAVGSSD